jgi:hypothetical protein
MITQLNIIGGFIVILVGTALLPTVAQQVGTAQADGNVTGAADTLVGLTTLFFALAIATSSIGERNAHIGSNIFMQNPEYRLTSLRRQDRSDLIALTNDNGNQSGWIYILNSDNKIKSEINKKIAAQGDTILKPLQREIFDETAEYMLTSLRGQDIGGNALETDKAHLSSESVIYSPTICYD